MDDGEESDYSRGKSLRGSNRGPRKNVTAFSTSEGRIFYHNHETKLSSWLPPVEAWNPGEQRLPYGWELAVDNDGKFYYINHLNKTTTHEDPRKDDDEPPPQPRSVELIRDPDVGFGFVAGSERPVIVRFVKEGGPSEHKLQAADQILSINGEDVRNARREHVINLVKSCKHSVILTVCQPHTSNATHKSAILTAAKKAKLKERPCRVRFADGVIINGSPLYCPSQFESCVPFIPNVLKVFLENGQTKTFKYDSSTTIEDVVNSLIEKLSIKQPEHFSLCVEHIKSIRKNKLTLLDPKDSLSKIAARPGAHNLRCLLRVAFVPRDASLLYEEDPATFDYLYSQCCNDVVQERFAPELKYEIALRLSALHLQQHAVGSGMINSSGKVNLKAIEKECGLEPFVPYSLLETMKRKELHKLLNHFLKHNQQLCPAGQKYLTVVQAKLHYLRIINELPSYGAKMFPTNIKDSSIESALLISPKYGISHVTSLRHSLPISLAKIEDVSAVNVTKDDELCYTVEMQLRNTNTTPLHFGLEDKDAEELVLVLQGYHRLFTSRERDYKPISVSWDVGDSWWTDSAPGYHGNHSVVEAPWSYLPSKCTGKLRTIDFAVPPPRPFTLTSSTSQAGSSMSAGSSMFGVDYNMNDTSAGQKSSEGIDLPSIVSMEILESQSAEDGAAKSDEVLKRVEEMQKIVADAENYLADTESLSAKHNSEEEDSISEHPRLKAADSLLLLTQLDGLSAVNDKEAISGDISPCESDTDSLGTASDSPSHPPSENIPALVTPDPVTVDHTHELSVQIPNSSPVKTTRSSSFGLHSPDVLPSLSDTENELIETLKNLQSNGEVQYGDRTLCVDPDIIDLTIIPPPSSPLPDTVPLKPENSTSGFDVPPVFYEEHSPPSSIQQLNSAHILTDLGDFSDFGSVQTHDTSSVSINSLQSFPDDIDEFIASVSVPPPPEPTENHLSSLIIPPPPETSPNFAYLQDEIIAKFWKATDDVKKMCSTLDAKPDSSPPLSAREVYSSNSGDSGYDSVVQSAYIPTFYDYANSVTDKRKFVLPTVTEKVVVEILPNNIQTIEYRVLKAKKGLTESNSCTDLRVKPDHASDFPESNGTNNYSRLARSHSWSAIHTCRSPLPVRKLPVTGKPPIPTCIQKSEKKRTKTVYPRSGRLSYAPTNDSQQPVNGTSSTQRNDAPRQYSTIDFLTDSQKESIYVHAQRDMNILLTHLEDLRKNRSWLVNQGINREKSDAAKEALAMESRQFVTASKLFVKCATELSPQTTAHLVKCVSLLERMCNIGEIVFLNTESQSEIVSLIDKLKEVAATYAFTVDTVHKLIYANETQGNASRSTYMELLMDHATSLATALSSLMKLLRAFDS